MPRKLLLLSFTLLAVLSCSVHCKAQVTHSFTEPVDRRQLAAAQPDIVGNVFIREGEKVKANQMLAELDNRVLKQALKIAELRAKSDSQINSAQATHSITRQKYEKLRPMLQNGHANPAEVEKARAEYETAAAELQLAKEKKQEYKFEESRIRAEIETRVIRSPFDGVVTEIHFRPGEFIASNERQLVTVVRLDQLRARFYLLAETVGNLRQGQQVQLAMGTKKTPVTGTIEFVSPITDADSGTSRVDVLIDNKKQKWRSGSVCVWGESAKKKVALKARGRGANFDD